MILDSLTGGELLVGLCQGRPSAVCLLPVWLSCPWCLGQSESLLERLEQCELFELTTAERLEVLRVLVHRLLDTDSLADRHRDLCLRKDAIARDLKAQRRQEEAAAPAQEPTQTQGPTPEPEPEPEPAAVGAGEQPDDLASRSKRTRRNLEQARQERQQKERERREK